MKITFTDGGAQGRSSGKSSPVTFVIGVGEKNALTALGREWDKKSGGALSKALAASRFAGKSGQFLSIPAPAGLPCERVVLAGMGKELDRLGAESLGGGLVAHLNSAGSKQAVVWIEETKGSKLDAGESAARIAYGAQLRSYRFDKYRTKEKAEDKPTLNALNVVLPSAKLAGAAKKEFQHLDALADSVFFTRNLVSEPANVIYPESLAAECKKLAKLGLKVEVLGEAQMKKLGMGSLLGVGQGSIRESQLVVLRWNGAPNDKKGPLAFVGKGVTFDTGGISIKPAGGMEDMKWDMAGSAVVIGLLRTLALRKAKVNAVGVVGLVENMPDGNAQRPGDVVTSMSGQTIEVINTDAEGRLVLADALWYTQSRFKPRFMVNLATLTGAIIISLGSSRAGLFSNNDELADKLFNTGKKVGEELWRLPLGDVYDKQINSYIADMKNVGEGREAGSITAAQFLQRFVNDVPWAHLDIAGVAWTNKDLATVPKGASAFGVRLLDEFVADHYE